MNRMEVIFTPSIARDPRLGIFLSPPDIFRETDSTSPAIDTGLCFFFFNITSASGSTRCCQQVTLAKKPVGDVTDSRRPELERFKSDLEEERLSLTGSGLSWRGTEDLRYNNVTCTFNK